MVISIPNVPVQQPADGCQSRQLRCSQDHPCQQTAWRSGRMPLIIPHQCQPHTAHDHTSCCALHGERPILQPAPHNELRVCNRGDPTLQDPKLLAVTACLQWLQDNTPGPFPKASPGWALQYPGMLVRADIRTEPSSLFEASWQQPDAPCPTSGPCLSLHPCPPAAGTLHGLLPGCLAGQMRAAAASHGWGSCRPPASAQQAGQQAAKQGPFKSQRPLLGSD